MWGALIVGAVSAAVGFTKFGLTGLLWGLARGAVVGAILSVVVRIAIEVGNPFD